MDYTLKQTVNDENNIIFEVLNSNSGIDIINIVKTKDHNEFKISFNNKYYYCLNIIKTKHKQKVIIYNNIKQELGNFLLDYKKAFKFFHSYSFFEFSFKNKLYNFYYILIKNEGEKFPIFYNNKQVALIEKSFFSLNDLDDYHIKTIDSINIDVSLLACIFIEITYFSNSNNIKLNRPKDYTYNQRLLIKYNKNFLK